MDLDCVQDLHCLLTERDTCKLSASSRGDLTRGNTVRTTFTQRTEIARLLNVPQSAKNGSVCIPNAVTMIQGMPTHRLKLWELVCANFIKLDFTTRQALVHQWAYHWSLGSSWALCDPRHQTLPSPGVNFHFIKGQWKKHVSYVRYVRHPDGFFRSIM